MILLMAHLFQHALAHPSPNRYARLGDFRNMRCYCYASTSAFFISYPFGFNLLVQLSASIPAQQSMDHVFVSLCTIKSMMKSMHRYYTFSTDFREAFIDIGIQDELFFMDKNRALSTFLALDRFVACTQTKAHEVV